MDSTIQALLAVCPALQVASLAKVLKNVHLASRRHLSPMEQFVSDLVATVFLMALNNVMTKMLLTVMAAPALVQLSLAGPAEELLQLVCQLHRAFVEIGS